MNSKQINDKVKNIGKLMSLESKKMSLEVQMSKETYIIQIMIYLRM